MIPNAVDTDAAATRSPNRSRPNSQEISLELEMSLTKLVEETNDEVRRISQRPPEPKRKPAPAKVRTPSTPDWVEEFNQESATKAKRPPGRIKRPPARIEEGITVASDGSKIKDVGNLEPGEVKKVLRELSQNRVLSEPEYQVLDLEMDAKGRVNSAAPRDHSRTSQNSIDGAALEKPARRSANWPLRLVAGLLICFGFLFLLENPLSLPKNSEATEIQR